MAFRNLFLLVTSYMAILCTPQVLGNRRQFRLPTAVQPKHYVLELLPLFEYGNWTSLGKVWIHLNCSQATDEIIFNINDLVIEKGSVTLSTMHNSATFKITNQEYDQKTQMYKLKLHKQLEVGEQYRLHMKFKGVLNDLLQGFYRSSYTDSVTGKNKWLVATQFSPTDARRAFPCWDEPAFKAKFTISVGRPSNLSTLSNMPIIHTSQVDHMPGWHWDHFKTSLPMSTYLVAFIVSDLAYAPAIIMKENFTFKVWSRRNALEQAIYSAQIGPKLLTFLEIYFGIPFPLPKLDMVALPDFGFNGMENWGLITFRESAMLYDKKVSTVNGKMQVGIVIGHEIAHQWFGNLVTPQWWGDLWLKEGFATYIGYTALDNVEPEWNIMGQFILDVLQFVLRSDSFSSSHKISNNIQDPRDIRQIFDEISYKKGASIIRMMRHFLGERHFRKGLEEYLMKHKFGNARQSDLWECLRGLEDVGLNITDVMDSWTLQPGYPVVSVMRNYTNNTATLTQERFLLSGDKGAEGLWWVPVSYTTEVDQDFESTRPTFWMSSKKKTVLIPQLPENKWFLINLYQAGYYRVNYDANNWELLTKSLNSFPVLIQAQLLDDAFNLASAAYIPYWVPFNMSEKLSSGSNYIPWEAAINNYKIIIRMLSNTGLEDKFKEYILSLLPEDNLDLGIQELPSDHQGKLHVVSMIKTASSLGKESLVKEAKAILKMWMEGDKVRILSDLKPSVYCTAVRYGGQEEWDFVWKSYLSSNVGSDKEVLLKALGCSKVPEILTKYLNLILDPTSGIRKQDGSISFSAVAGSKVGASLALEFMIKNWHELQNHFGQAFNRISGMVTSLGNYLNTEQQLNKVRKLYNDNKSDLGTTEMSFMKTIEQIQINIKWVKNNLKYIEEWLQKKRI